MPDLPRDQYQQKFKDDAFVRHEAARRSKAVKRARPAQLDLFGGGGYTTEEIEAGKSGIADARSQLAGHYQRSRFKEFWKKPPTNQAPPCLGCGDH